MDIFLWSLAAAFAVVLFFGGLRTIKGSRKELEKLKKMVNPKQEDIDGNRFTFRFGYVILILGIALGIGMIIYGLHC